MKPHGLSKAHVIELGGLTLIPDLSGALFIRDYNTLVIADLHLEQGASLARRGIHAPPYDSRQSLARLAIVVAAVNPEHLIFLGDSFHDATTDQFIADDDRKVLTEITKARNAIWITGNHDPEIPMTLGGNVAEEVNLGPLTLRHAPKLDLGIEFEIAGHLHPGASLTQRGRHIRTKCFIADKKRVIIPAFGSYTGAFSISAPAFEGLFVESQTKVLMLGQKSLHQFPRHKLR